MEDTSMRFLYGTAPGRVMLRALLRLGLPKALAGYLRSPLSRARIKRYIKKHDIPMEDYPQEQYRCFADFFSRKKLSVGFDASPGHLIAPCDSLLSVYGVGQGSRFLIKGFRYSLSELTGESSFDEKYAGGLCLVYRLTASDYHHYIYTDGGHIGAHHFFEGKLHSVQPSACSAFPVYRINRRSWSCLESDSFGSVLQVEIGALAVGGIVSEHENERVEKGAEMGHFELCGSTVAQFFEKDRVRLLPELSAIKDTEEEIRITIGAQVGFSAAGKD